MTAWDFSPEQREIINEMIETALDRRLGPGPGNTAGIPEQGITLAPASVQINLKPPAPPPVVAPAPFGFFGLRGLFVRLP